LKESTVINNGKILVVEDEPTISKLCQEALYREGFKSDIAFNGQVAKSMIERKQYNLYLIDIKMPVMDGKKLYQWLQSRGTQMANKVVFITGSVYGEQTKAFLEKTGRPYLLKPFTPEELTTVVKKTYQEQE